MFGRMKNDQEQLAFDQAKKFATRPGDDAWKMGLISSLEQASTGYATYQRWEDEVWRAIMNAVTRGNEVVRDQKRGGETTLRDMMIGRLSWLVYAAEHYGGMHAIMGQEIDHPTPVTIDRYWETLWTGTN